MKVPFESDPSGTLCLLFPRYRVNLAYNAFFILYDIENDTEHPVVDAIWAKLNVLYETQSERGLTGVDHHDYLLLTGEEWCVLYDSVRKAIQYVEEQYPTPLASLSGWRMLQLFLDEYALPAAILSAKEKTA